MVSALCIAPPRNCMDGNEILKYNKRNGYDNIASERNVGLRV